MIQLKGITKEYSAGDMSVTALKDINITLRQNEFVAILGPSGGGKTTLLNIIGGLDQYTRGDLIINGISTKDYKDRDWDTYRNHTVGFVFQNYNLISHQSVLANVELALTLSGVSSSERRRRAIYALEAVGLGDQLKKKPNQLSGGQMQRVAIARALVNDPDILLADEPTGALDTKTSIQVMDILKKVASDRLVVMVTHNPELAKRYATRIISLTDGEITGDTDNFTPEELIAEKPKKRIRKPSMGFIPALALSLNNLLTKKGRTLLTSFAGSIGIIGIALILSLSNGVNGYIARIQEETLSSYPLVIENTGTDLTGMMTAIMGSVEEADAEGDRVKELQIVTDMFSRIGTNDLGAFKKFLEENPDITENYVNCLQYSYGITPRIYSSDHSEVLQLNPSALTPGGGISSAYISSSFFNRMMDNRGLLEEQYDVAAGRWPDKYDELVLVLESPNTISDFMLYSLGLRDQDAFVDMFTDVMNGEKVSSDVKPMEFSYSDFLSMEFTMVLPCDYYQYDSQYKVFNDMSDDEDYMKDLLEKGLPLKVVGIVYPKEGSVAASLSAGIAYTGKLTEYIIEQSRDREIVTMQLADKSKDVFSGKTFDELNEKGSESGLDFQDMIQIDTEAISAAFGLEVDENELREMMGSSILAMTGEISADTSPAETAFSDAFTDIFNGIVNSRMEEGSAVFTALDTAEATAEYMQGAAAQEILSNLSATYPIPVENYSQIFGSLCGNAIASAAQSAGGQITFTPQNTSPIIQASLSNPLAAGTVKNMGKTMVETKMKVAVMNEATQMGMGIITAMAGGIKVDTDAFASAFQFKLEEDELSRLMSTMTSSSAVENTAATNLAKLGYADIQAPTRISVYLTDFESKDAFKEVIAKYNKDMEEAGKEEYVLNYTDITGILMSSVTSIVNTVSYVLVAFVSVSLVVSSIMIGIITYISVLERTKEIGLLRAMGASKRDISRVFNAETFIIGLCSGTMGILITVALCFPINKIMRSLTNIQTLRAYLQPAAGVILVVISVILTLIAGLIPSRIAAKKDPVTSLRTE